MKSKRDNWIEYHILKTNKNGMYSKSKKKM